MNEVEITPELITEYLASKQENDIIGLCNDATHCLVAEALKWKYKNIETVAVYYNFTDITFLDGSDVSMQTPASIARIFEAFDRIDDSGEEVTKLVYQQREDER